MSTALMRKKVFYLLDYLRGGELSSNIKEVEMINLNPYGHLQKRFREQQLNCILKYAVSNCNFYSDLGLRSFPTLNDFPVLNKDLIKSRYKDFISKEFKNLKKLKKASTSGSTGTPFEVHHSRRKVVRNRADNIFFGEFANYKPGVPLYYLRVWNSVNKQGFLKRLITNVKEVDVSDLSFSSLRSILDTIRKAPSNAVILGYGSALQALGDYIVQNNVYSTGTIGGIWIMAEPISCKVQSVLKKTFNCPVVARYSTAENGFLAHQFSETSQDYMLNYASYAIELLHFDKNTPVKLGEPGRVVITDLFNEVLPMIRYDTGDIATGGELVIKGRTLPVLKKMEGRKLDYLSDTSGNNISPHTIDYALRSLENLVQFQFSQEEEKNYLLKIVSHNKDERLKAKSMEALKYYLGNDAEIKVVFTDEIPLLRSGKRKMVENNYKESRLT